MEIWFLLAAVGGVAAWLLSNPRRTSKRRTAPRQTKAPKTAKGTPLTVAVRGGADLLIRYRDADGDETERTITVQHLVGEADGKGGLRFEKIEARCHTRKARRTFVLARIHSVADGRTGEIIDLPAGLATWLQKRVK